MKHPRNTKPNSNTIISNTGHDPYAKAVSIIV